MEEFVEDMAQQSKHASMMDAPILSRKEEFVGGMELQ